MITTIQFARLVTISKFVARLDIPQKQSHLKHTISLIDSMLNLNFNKERFNSDLFLYFYTFDILH